MDLRDTVLRYVPLDDRESADKRVMLECFDRFDDLLTRNNEVAHFTASAWITDRDRGHVLMIYHNIYDSWAWTGGHADGETDLAAVALREAKEETGLIHVRSVSPEPISLEILPVCAHIKRGRYVVPHLHLNLTYLLEADMHDTLRVCPDENSNVRWFTPEEAILASTEPDMKLIYDKLNRRMISII